ncbi:MAG: mucoidy inhibitor MuiA family protein, partial [Myxococcota bacterium]|nr:mucoidy inhibitor MuiA family protein [Myxococcota bacterium]
MFHHHRALRGPLSTLLTLATLVVTPMAMAGGGDMDFAAEAKRRMNLSFDLDEVEGMLQQEIPLAYSSVAVAPLPLEPNSEMAAVTVFRDRALVTRVLEERAKPGDGSVTFEGLPLGIAADSLHATVLKGDARIIGVELLSGRGEVEETDGIQQIRDEMLGITEELGQVRDRIESLLAQRTYLRDTVLQDRNQAPAPSLEQIRGTLNFVGDAERDIAAELRTEQERARELDEELRPLLIKLENPLATGNQVRVDLAAVAGGPITVGLRYQVFGAGWWPAYNARLEESSAQVTLEYYGIVSQTTGEDWDEVDLELSTANPSVSGELPSLSSWYLGRNAYGGSYSVQDNLMSGRGYYDMAGNEMQANPQTVVPQAVVETRMNASVQ